MTEQASQDRLPLTWLRTMLGITWRFFWKLFGNNISGLWVDIAICKGKRYGHGCRKNKRKNDLHNDSCCFIGLVVVTLVVFEFVRARDGCHVTWPFPCGCALPTKIGLDPRFTLSLRAACSTDRECDYDYLCGEILQSSLPHYCVSGKNYFIRSPKFQLMKSRGDILSRHQPSLEFKSIIIVIIEYMEFKKIILMCNFWKHNFSFLLYDGLACLGRLGTLCCCMFLSADSSCVRWTAAS